jgi:4-hydroxy-tetrahydrodipicolinate synthase
MIYGSIVALVTPMSTSGAIDYPALQRLVEWHVSSGSNAIVAVGTTGESATLNVDEHVAVIRAVLDAVAGRIPVIAGTGANSTDEAIELTKRAKEAGADACLLVTPYYNKPTQRGLLAHYKTIAAAVDIPQILYNVPGRTACDLLPDTVVELSSVPNIIGIKEATGDLSRGKELLERCSKDFIILSGDDATALELILLGAKGNIGVTCNVVPSEIAEICALGLAGKAEEARALDARVACLHKDLFVEANPIPVKWALMEMGRISEGIRLPLVTLDPKYQSIVRASLQKAGAL